MHKFYWNGRHRGPPAVLPGHRPPTGTTTVGVYHVDQPLSTSKSEHSLLYPSVPVRHDAKTVVRVTADDGEEETVKKARPTGSHRVLLKLRRMTAAQRPSSVHEDGLETCSVRSGYLPTSKSTEAFNYNQTWNERSLRKAGGGGSHNYENVYSGSSPTEDWAPPYENFLLPPKPSRFSQHPNYENVFAEDRQPRGPGRFSLDETRVIKAGLLYVSNS